MGEAKKRGTFEERKQQAIDRQQREYEERQARRALMPQRRGKSQFALAMATIAGLGAMRIRRD